MIARVFITCATLCSTASCNYGNYEPPKIECNAPALTPTTTIAEVFKTSQAKPQAHSGGIMEGYVVSSDSNGHFYKSIVLQSVDSKFGCSLSIDETNLHTTYKVGQKVYVNLENLCSQISNNQLVIGFGCNGSRPGYIPKTDYKKALTRSCQQLEEDLLVNKIELKEVSDPYLNRLVELSNVQFSSVSVNKSFYDESNSAGGATNHVLESLDGHELVLRTRSFADFANQKTSSKSGTVRGILSKYGSTYQILIRTIDDIKLDRERLFLQRITIDALRKKTLGVAFTDLTYVEGVVTLSGYADKSKNQENIAERLAIIQDHTAGIALYFDADAHQLSEGDNVRVCLSSYKLSNFAGLLRLQNLDFDGRFQNGEKHVQVLSSNHTMPAPKPATINQLLAGHYQSEFVVLGGVQVMGHQRGLSFSGRKMLSDCSENITLQTRSKALFSRDLLPDGNGDLIGIAHADSEVQVVIKNKNGAIGMINPRCDETSLIFEENFETVANTGDGAFIRLPFWNNLSNNGSPLVWEAQRFGNNTYVQASAYNKEQTLDAWLIMPAIDLDTLSDAYLKFKTKDGYNNGNVLRVYASTNFDGVEVSKADWAPLSATIASGNSYGYAPLFTDSGKVDLSRFSGKIHIAFRYANVSASITTTMQIDEIQVFGKLKP